MKPLRGTALKRFLQHLQRPPLDVMLFLHDVEDPVTVNDFQATVLRCLGLDHEKLTYRFQGRDFRLTDVAGEPINKILA